MSRWLAYCGFPVGLEHDAPTAVARAVGLVEETARRHGVEQPVQMTVATLDGETTWAFRSSTEGRSRSLFHSTDVSTLGDLLGAWREVPEASCLVVHSGQEELRPFAPTAP